MTDHPVLLDETGLPTRYYLPREDIRTDLLRPSSLETTCPFKGQVSYWSAVVGDEVHESLAWSYETPNSLGRGNCRRPAVLLSRAGRLTIDGELSQARPERSASEPPRQDSGSGRWLHERPAAHGMPDQSLAAQQMDGLPDSQPGYAILLCHRHLGRDRPTDLQLARGDLSDAGSRQSAGRG